MRRAWFPTTYAVAARSARSACTMPEGYTVSAPLERSSGTRRQTRPVSVRVPALNRVDADHPLACRTSGVGRVAREHLLRRVGRLVLRTTFAGTALDIYVQATLRSPTRHRVPSPPPTIVAVGFNIPVAEFLSRADLARHAQPAKLGPDLAAEDFDRDEVLRRLRGLADTPIADALLDQRAVAGIGNVLKSEVLFVSGVDPFATVRQLRTTPCCESSTRAGA